MIFLATRFGFIAELIEGTNHLNEPVLKARHCIDVREALPFTDRGKAEQMFRRTNMAKYWHCALSSLDGEEV